MNKPARSFAEWAPRVRQHLERFCGGPGSRRPGPCAQGGSQAGATKPIQFVRDPSASSNEVLVHVDPQKLDKAWQRDSGYYLPSNDRGPSEVPGRREEFARFLAKGKAIQAPRVSLDADGGAVSFTNGRHRFAVLRDIGAGTVAVTVPRSQAGHFRTYFGPGEK